MKENELDLTAGPVARMLARYAAPLLLANLLQSLYSMVDLMVVGRVVGESGLAAVSNASMVCFLINALCIGFTTGGTVLTARHRGAGDRAAEAETAGALFALSLLGAAGVTAAGLLLYEPLFALLEVPAGAMGDACGYMRVICWGTPFVFAYNALCAVLKGRGDARSPLAFVAVAAGTNVLLDLLLIGPCGLGTAGAAWATVAAQGLSCLCAALCLWRRRVPIAFPRQKGRLWALLKVGLPTAAQMVTVNVSYLLVTGMVNQFGVAVAAASGIGLKVNTLAGMPCWAVGQAVTAMAGQCLGAGDWARAGQSARVGLRLNVLVTAGVAALVQIWAGPIVALFGPAGGAAETAVLYLRLCCSVNSLVYAAMYTLDSFAIGAGGARVALFNALLDGVLVRLPLSWLLAFPWEMGFLGVYLGQMLSPLLPAAIGFLYYRRGAWRRGTG